MAVLLESPWYREILQQGLQQGLQEGRREEAQRSLLRILQLRFNAIPSPMRVALQRLSLDQLEEVMEMALKVNSLDEFASQLPPGLERDAESTSAE